MLTDAKYNIYNNQTRSCSTFHHFTFPFCGNIKGTSEIGHFNKHVRNDKANRFPWEGIIHLWAVKNCTNSVLLLHSPICPVLSILSRARKILFSLCNNDPVPVAVTVWKSSNCTWCDKDAETAAIRRLKWMQLESLELEE